MKLRKTAEAPLRAVAFCRGEGLGYVAVSSNQELASLRIEVTNQKGLCLPSGLYSVMSAELRESLAPGAARAWVATLPLVADDCTLVFAQNEDELLTTTFPALLSKVSSRLLTIAKPHVADALRGFERSYGWGKTQVDIFQVWPLSEQEVVWRIRAVFPTQDAKTLPQIELFDQNSRTISARSLVMEDQVAPDARGSSEFVRIVTFSCTVSKDIGSFYAVARLGEEPELCGFDGMNAPRAAGMLAGVCTMIGGAPINVRYAEWFEQNRATESELRRQREACASLPEERHPFISLVMPVYRTPETYLRSALESVMAQSYDRWELVVVNASGVWPEVDRTLAAFPDERIRVTEVENKSIAENTNVGIALAQGDYVGFMDHDDVLEPDALWHYARAIAKNPKADLLYCDEDHLAGTHVHAPAFKTFPNYGKLYEHNYITHLLMVSAWALERTERSGKDVAGAQDFDLTLKAFEVARDVCHIPRVLYHWREHEQSTSGGEDQKPFAHEAGRRALQAHLERRGIVARVEDGVLPYTYRVCYELPYSVPKVSIVIPTRDQVDLLRRCVSSILDKTTYPDYEIVLVENNSTQPQTFALYDELCTAHDRVRVVTWEPPQPGGFNYSAIVNYGVAHTTGEYVVLLNNDTEVIEPRWLEYMAGCLMRSEVGIVGAKLLFGDGLIQHVGMVANPEGNFCHVCQNLSVDALGPGYAAAMPGDYSMVTGACQMVRRTLFNELGGYDEQLAVGFNDGDFCLRARSAGYAVTVCAQALLHHREFSTRAREVTDARLRSRFLVERARMVSKHAEFFAQGDPAMNPNLDPFSGYFDI